MERVLVIERTYIKRYIDNAENVFITDRLDEIRGAILKKAIYMDRDIAEQDTCFKQIIPYVLIKHEGSFLLLERLKGQSEARLHSKLSLGLGGHINPSDHGDPIMGGLLREVNEEVALDYDESPVAIGVINDDTTDVGRVHLGLAYVLNCRSGRFEVIEKLKMEGFWVSKSSLPENYDRLEGWSQILFDHYINRM